MIYEWYSIKLIQLELQLVGQDCECVEDLIKLLAREVIQASFSESRLIDQKLILCITSDFAWK